MSADLYGSLDEKKKKRKKAGTESSKESSLRDWFGRKGAKGKKKGWVDCNAPDGKGGYKSCGRSSGEKRKRYPACRPTPGACKERGRGKSWGKKSKKSKKNEELQMDLEQIILEVIEEIKIDGRGFPGPSGRAEETPLSRDDVLRVLRDPEGMDLARKHPEIESTFMKIAGLADIMVTEEDKEQFLQLIKDLYSTVEANVTAGPDQQVDIDNLQELENRFIKFLDEKKKKKQQKGKKRAAKKAKRKKKKAKKDACYHKVKSRYKVWPSAYASGALVKCRKVGAKNWGNSKKEALQIVVEDEISQMLVENIEKTYDNNSIADIINEETEKYLEESLYYGLIEEEDELLEKKKKKKACKPSKGKKFARRVKGKCVSYGQAGKAKDGGARIKPGTGKGNAYCARSYGDMKSHGKDCSGKDRGTPLCLSRQKWKCSGKYSRKGK